jgi:hypothetical protein
LVGSRPVALKVGSCKAFKATTALKRTINPTRVPIEQKRSVCHEKCCWGSYERRHEREKIVRYTGFKLG